MIKEGKINYFGLCVFTFNGRCLLFISLDGDQCSNHSLVLSNFHVEMIMIFFKLAYYFYASGKFNCISFYGNLINFH